MSELGFEPRVDSFYSPKPSDSLFPRSLHVETHPLVHPYPALLPRDFPPPWPRALRSCMHISGVPALVWHRAGAEQNLPGKEQKGTPGNKFEGMWRWGQLGAELCS